jgi:hypothetical protein
MTICDGIIEAHNPITEIPPTLSHSEIFLSAMIGC